MVCFGSLLKILMTSTQAGVQQQDVCSELIMAVGGSNLVGDHTKITRLLKSEGNVPDDAVEGAKNIAFEDVVGKLNGVLLSKYIAEDRIPMVILALKDVLNKDSMGDNTHLAKYMKSELMSMVDVDAAEFLACFLIYSCTEVANRDGRDGKTDFITQDYVDLFDSKKNTIRIVTEPVIKTQQLQCTLNRDDFDQIFIESDGAGQLNNPNYSQVRLFYLDIENNEFAYDSLNDFLVDNIGYYVLSRTEMQALRDRHKEQAACLRAIRAMNQHGIPGEKGTGNDLGEVMVYAFLEDVLGAPKILTKAEIVGGTPGSRTDGVHLLKLNDSGRDKYQLVLAASDITGDIKNAVDSVIQRLDDIVGVARNERQMVDRAVLSSSFDADTTSYLKSILIPSRAASGRPDISFGIFIGYSLGIDPLQYDNGTYRVKAMEKMKRDVEDIAPYISTQLANAFLVSNGNLVNHSFYFYFMPFDDADNDKDEIMQNLLSGGVSNGTI